MMTASGSAANASITVPSAPGDLLVAVMGQGDRITGHGASQTAIFIDNISTGTTLDNAAATYSSGAPSVVTSWNFSIVDEWQTIAVSLQP